MCFEIPLPPTVDLAQQVCQSSIGKQGQRVVSMEHRLAWFSNPNKGLWSVVKPKASIKGGVHCTKCHLGPLQSTLGARFSLINIKLILSKSYDMIWMNTRAEISECNPMTAPLAPCPVADSNQSPRCQQILLLFPLINFVLFLTTLTNIWNEHRCGIRIKLVQRRVWTLR